MLRARKCPRTVRRAPAPRAIVTADLVQLKPAVAAAELFPVGTRVSGLYKNGSRYPATVAEVHDSGEYLLNWDDGDQADRVKRAEQLLRL